MGPIRREHQDRPEQTAVLRPPPTNEPQHELIFKNDRNAPVLSEGVQSFLDRLNAAQDQQVHREELVTLLHAKKEELAKLCPDGTARFGRDVLASSIKTQLGRDILALSNRLELIDTIYRLKVGQERDTGSIPASAVAAAVDAQTKKPDRPRSAIVGLISDPNVVIPSALLAAFYGLLGFTGSFHSMAIGIERIGAVFNLNFSQPPDNLIAAVFITATSVPFILLEFIGKADQSGRKTSRQAAAGNTGNETDTGVDPK